MHRSSVESFGAVDLQYHLEQMFLFGGNVKEPPQGLGCPNEKYTFLSFCIDLN